MTTNCRHRWVSHHLGLHTNKKLRSWSGKIELRRMILVDATAAEANALGADDLGYFVKALFVGYEQRAERWWMCTQQLAISDRREHILFMSGVISGVALRRRHIATADQATLNPSDKIKEYMQVMSILEGNASVTKRQQLWDKSTCIYTICKSKQLITWQPALSKELTLK